MIATGSIIDGHGLASDWLFLVAACVFLIAAVAVYFRQPPGHRDVVPSLVPLGLAIAATAFWVL